MKLPWNRPKAPPSVLRTGLCSPLACALGLPAVCEVKEVVVESGAARNMGLRGHKGVALVPKSEEVQKSFQEPVWSGKPSGTTQEKNLAQMDISKLLDLLGKEHTTVANRLLSSIHELRRRDDSSIVLNTQNFSQSLTSMSSDMSILRDTPTNPVEERGDGDAVKLMEEKTPKIPMLAKQPTSQIPQVLEDEPESKVLPVEEGRDENIIELPQRHSGSCSPSSRSNRPRTPRKHVRIAFQSIQDIQGDFQPEQPGDLQNAFAFYSAHGAPYGDKKRSPQPHKAQMCGSSFSRMCKSNGLVANHIGRQDVIFTEVKRKEKGAKTLSFQEFELALGKLAELNHVPVQAIRSKVIEGSKDMIMNRPLTPV